MWPILCVLSAVALSRFYYVLYHLHIGLCSKLIQCILCQIPPVETFGVVVKGRETFIIWIFEIRYGLYPAYTQDIIKSSRPFTTAPPWFAVSGVDHVDPKRHAEISKREISFQPFVPFGRRGQLRLFLSNKSFFYYDVRFCHIALNPQGTILVYVHTHIRLCTIQNVSK